MSEVFIPLGGAGGKNRGNSFYIPDTAPTAEVFGRIITPLPAGVYKKFVTPDGQIVFPSADGGDAVVSMSREFLKKQAIKTFGIASITNFSLSMYAHRQVRLTWAKPDRGLWSGVHFVFKYGSMPTNENDGFMFYDSADVHYETPKLEERELYVRAYSYVTVRDGRWYDEGAVSARITVTGISGSVTLSTGAGTWTVPANVYKIRYILVGHGGNGGGANYGNRCTGGGGGGYFVSEYMDVTPGQGINWLIPSSQNSNTSLGGAIARSGENGTYFYDGDRNHIKNVRGGNGGSGGGGGSPQRSNWNTFGGAGGSDGSDGQTVNSKYGACLGGAGQHSSTRGFNGVLYSGGGAGGGLGSHPANGGAGGGGMAVDARRLLDNKYRGLNLDVSRGNGVDGLGGGGGGIESDYRNDFYIGGDGYLSLDNGGLGGTGCIYIAWGSAMNDGS